MNLPERSGERAGALRWKRVFTRAATISTVLGIHALIAFLLLKSVTSTGVATHQQKVLMITFFPGGTHEILSPPPLVPPSPKTRDSLLDQFVRSIRPNFALPQKRQRNAERVENGLIVTLPVSATTTERPRSFDQALRERQRALEHNDLATQVPKLPGPDCFKRPMDFVDTNHRGAAGIAHFIRQFTTPTQLKKIADLPTHEPRLCDDASG